MDKGKKYVRKEGREQDSFRYFSYSNAAVEGEDFGFPSNNKHKF